MVGVAYPIGINTLLQWFLHFPMKALLSLIDSAYNSTDLLWLQISVIYNDEISKVYHEEIKSYVFYYKPIKNNIRLVDVQPGCGLTP